jgi:D-xylose transport system permease protein
LSNRIIDAVRGNRSIPVVVVLAVIWIVFYSQNSAYLSFQNLTNLTLQIATTAILALGVVFVLLVGEIDLSSAVLSGVAAAVAAGVVVNHGMPLIAGLAAGILSAVVFTFVEALAIIFGIPSLIVTLGGMVVLQGLILVVLPPEFTISVAGTSFGKIASTAIPAGTSYALAAVATLAYLAYRLATRSRAALSGVVISAVILAAVLFGGVYALTRQRGLPMPVLIVAVMLLIAWYVTTQTRYGIHLYAVGGDREAAQRAGIPVRRMVLYSFLILGACSAVAGMVDASRQLGVSVTSGAGPLMLNAIAAAVVGGTSLFGGRGSIWSAALGALIIGSISNGVQLLGLSTEVQFFATGIVLVVAVGIDVVLTRGSLLPGRRS